MENYTGDILMQQVFWGHNDSWENDPSFGLQSLGCGVDLKVQGENQMTRSNPGLFQIAVLFLYYGRNHNIRKNGASPTLYQEIEGECQIQCGTDFTKFNEIVMY